MTRRPTLRYATPRPWEVQERVGDLIPVRSTVAPFRDACFVPIDGNVIEAEQTALLIAWWSRTQGTRA